MGEEVKRPSRRSYGQFCALARALDVVGDRWNLLIVRELLAGPLRYGELKDSVGDIASNLLAARLRGLEADGVIERRSGASSVAYALTPWGRELREALEALGRWGTPLLTTGRGDDAFRVRWLVLALPALLRGRTTGRPWEIGFEVEGVVVVVRLDENGADARVAPPDGVDAVLAAPAEVVVGLVAGSIRVEQAVAAGRLHGDVEELHRAFGDIA